MHINKIMVSAKEKNDSGNNFYIRKQQKIRRTIISGLWQPRGQALKISEGWSWWERGPEEEE